MHSARRKVGRFFLPIMNTITLSLLALRDILTNYDTTAALNAARHHESRQLYATHDWVNPKRIVPADLGRLIADADPDGQVFFVQIKTLPVTLIDQWTPTPEYAVVRAAGDWLSSAEYKLSRSESWQREFAALMATSSNEDRLSNMAAIIIRHMPAVKHNIHDIITAEYRKSEAALRSFIGVFETALNNLPIYEAPTGTETSDQGVQGAASGSHEVESAPAQDGADTEHQG